MTKMNNFQIAIEDLKQKLNQYGDIILPGDSKYDSCIKLDNSRVISNPAAILRPYSKKQSQKIISYLSLCQIPFAIKNGGHSYAGYSLVENGVVIDISGIKDIAYIESSSTLIVGGGVNWGEVYTYIRKNSIPKYAIGGACLSVGVAGFIMGGGYSFLSRSYGLGADNIDYFKIITPEGELIKASLDGSVFEREIYWAVLGGGGGNFGLIIETCLKLQPKPTNNILCGELVFNKKDIKEVMNFYNQWAHIQSNKLAVYGWIGYIKGELKLRLQVVYNGNYENGLKKILPLIKFKPETLTLHNISFEEYMDLCDEKTSIKGRKSYMRSGLLKSQAFDSNMIEIIIDEMSNPPSTDSFVLWMHQGGETENINTESISYHQRFSQYIFELVTVWEKDNKSANSIEWGYEFGEKLDSYFHGAFVNYIDPLLKDWEKKYYGNNWSRLLELKKQIDRENLLSFKQGIPVK